LAVTQISGTTSTEAAMQPPPQSQPAGDAPSSEPLGFRSRGGARRRARFLRKARELGYRDLGGLVFNLHRFGQRNDALVLAKLTTLSHIDAELQALESALAERRAVTILREAGITACPRCAAIHSSEDNFCPNCGFSMRRHADLPIATPAPTSGSGAGQTLMPAATAAQAPAPASTPPAPDMPRAQSAVPTGRSPTPPSSPATQPSNPQPEASSRLSEAEDGPTEILGPPVSGQ
jgi:hypothetical protein